MKIVMMGAGAMGSLFGGLLAYSGEEVWLVDIRKETVDLLNAVGLTYEKEGRIQLIGANATTDVKSIGKADLVIFFVKTYHTEKAVSDALNLEHPDTVFLTLQNGLGNEEVICKQISPKKVMLGVTGQAATLMGPGHIRHAGWAKTFIGELDHKVTDRASQIAKTFQEAGIETELSPNIHDLMWEKLLVNVGINLTALTEMKNGELLDHPETVRLMEALVSEAAEVAKRKGIPIQGNPMDLVKSVSEATRNNRSSMLQDFDYRRRTEIDAINGAVVREAEGLGLPAPFNQMVTDLVKANEIKFLQSPQGLKL
jgi:2-dehydropantoate 2-reductase